MQKKFIYVTIIAAILVGAVVFYGGMKYSRAKAMPNFSQKQFGQGQFAPGDRNGAQRPSSGGFTGGEIISKDDKSITIKSSDGGSKIIFISDATEVLKSVTASSTDLNIGDDIMVNGTANQDGSITAQSVQIRPVAEQISDIK